MPAAELASVDAFAALVQYPGANGDVRDYAALAASLHARGGFVIAAADLLALAILAPPGEWGADVVVGSAQRFGVPMGFGGPHAGYMATRDELKRNMPGRLVGVTVDAQGHTAYRLALQTREQHIRREKATSNICTAQVLLAVMASMYAVYHGPAGLERIARRVHRLATILKAGLETARVRVPRGASSTRSRWRRRRQDRRDRRARAGGADELPPRRRRSPRHLARRDHHARRRGSDPRDLRRRPGAVHRATCSTARRRRDSRAAARAPRATSTHPVFNRHHSETEMLRYLRSARRQGRRARPLDDPAGLVHDEAQRDERDDPGDLARVRAPASVRARRAVAGYRELIEDLEERLAKATGYAAVSIQPNAGSQGEYAGLLIIRTWHESRGEGHRNVCLIPSSAHGTNPASAQMAGMQVVVVGCDAGGNVDLGDLERKAAQHAADLAALMVTYPSTHGVFEAGITRRSARSSIAHGGQVYVDGANMNAMVGLCAPGRIRRRRLAPEPAQDVLHSARRRRPGRGPGRGRRAPRAVPARAIAISTRPKEAIGAVTAAPFGSASILPISWMYIEMMGGEGLTAAMRGRDPQRQLHRQAPRAALPGALRGPGRPGRARVHPRPAPAEGDLRHQGRGRRQAPHRLRLPRADDVVPGRGHADGRAHRERIEGRARPLLRRDDRDPRRGPRGGGGAHGPRGQPAEARAAHRGGGDRRRMDAPATRASSPPIR